MSSDPRRGVPRTRLDLSVRRDSDLWFRSQGLPTFVPLRRWFTDLPRRVAPLLAWVAVVMFLLRDGFDDAFDIALEFFDYFDDFDVAVVFILLILLVLSAVIAWAVYLAVRWMLRRLSIGIGTLAAGAVIIACVALLVVDGYESDAKATVGPVMSTAAILLACALVTGMGGGALLSWATRLALRNASAIGHMASIALPVILMLVVFAMYSAELWQVAAALSWGSLALLSLVIAVLAVIVVLRVSGGELDDVTLAPSDEKRAALLVGTPAEHLGAASDARDPLRLPQRINILLVMTFAQLLQALFFGALLWALLLIISTITIPVGVAEIWLGPGSPTQSLAVEPIVIDREELPFTVTHLKTSALLALIATLPFIFSAVSEPRYRDKFFDPIMADLRRAIVVRDALG